ncbi:hypothetical protein [Thioclava sp. GXIMD4215]|uniref:hypothetical protein n=1 Tax=Thioclava sp. GXIMD4215 TaxID=3131928 RepID=UPI0032550A02
MMPWDHLMDRIIRHMMQRGVKITIKGPELSRRIVPNPDLSVVRDAPPTRDDFYNPPLKPMGAVPPPLHGSSHTKHPSCTG